ncbi:MAG: hypothetical protein ABIG95_03965 [Candidatus Woesearchaeota archaeon]
MAFLRTNFSILILILVFLPLVSAEYAVNAKIDRIQYPIGSNITLSGTVYEDTALSSNTTIYYRIGSSPYSNTTTETDGSFSAEIPSPEIGEYNLTVTVGTSSFTIPFSVTEYEYLIIEFVEDYHPIVCSDDDGIITDVPEADQECDAYSETGYYFVLVANSAGDYDSLFADTDNSVNEADSVYKYLKQGNSLKISGEDYSVIYIDPFGGMFVLGKKSDTYYETDTEQQVLIIGVNSTGSPGENLSLTYDLFSSSQTLDEGDFNETTGVTNATINVTGNTGTYYFAVGGFYSSVKIERFSIKVVVEDEEGNPVFKTSTGQKLNLVMAVTNKTDGSVIEDAIGSAFVSYPGGSEIVTLAVSASKSLEGEFEVPDVTGEYTVLFTANVSDDSNAMITKLSVVNYDLSLLPIAAGDKGRMEGFAPNQPGAILIYGKDAEGEFLNLTSIFNCSAQNVTINGIFDKNNKKYPTSAITVSRLEDFLDNLDMPIEVKEKQQIYSQLGRESCVIAFTAPSRTDNYVFKADVKLGSETYRLAAPVLVQDVFVDAWPTSPDGKSFVNAVGIGGTVHLGIKAYDQITGQQISKDKITGVTLVEVNSETGLVTEKMLNVSFSNSDEAAILRFTANDSVGGFHNVRFRIRVNVTRNGTEVMRTAEGQGWFKEKLYSIWVYPAASSSTKGAFGSNSTVMLTVNVRDAGGTSGMEDKTVSLDTLRYQTGETIDLSSINSGQSASCTTNSTGACDLSFSPPSEGWDSGFYNLRVKVTNTELNDDDSETTMSDYGYGWFDVRNFYFWPYVNQYEISKEDDNITFVLNAYDFEGNPLNGSAIVKKILYLGTWSSWAPPIVVAENADGLQGVSSSIVNGAGTITLDNIYISKPGNYQAVVEATSGSQTESGMAWFIAKTFTLYVVHDWSQMTYGINDQMNITLKGYEKISGWSGNEPTGTPKNLSEAWVQSIEKEGMWGMPYRKRSDLASSMSSVCSGNICQLLLNLSGFAQGRYNLLINAKDDLGNQVEGYYWMNVEVLGIRMPVRQMDQVLTTYRLTNLTRMNLTGDCGSSSDQVIEPQNVTSCKSSGNSGKSIADMKQSFWNDRRDSITSMSCQSGETCVDYGNMDYTKTHFILDVTNESNPRLFVQSDCNSAGDVCNFTAASFYVPGQLFTDAAGNQWLIKSIDVVNYVVNMEVVGAVIGYQGVEDTGEGALHNRYLIKVNSSWSKSGRFYQGPSIHDQEWLELDLDNDGIIEWSEEYPAIIADPVVAGQYDTLIVSNSTDFLADGIMSTSPISFGGSPTYVTSIRYRSGSSSQDGGSSGSDMFRVTYTGNKAPEWMDTDLGTVKPATILKVPIIITSPGNRSNKIANATVTITSMVRMGMNGEKSYSLADPVMPVNTSDEGIAVLTVNTTGLPNGEYFMKIQVDYSGNTVTMGAIYDNPRINLRNFEVRGEIGDRATIPGFIEISESAGNILIMQSDSMFHNIRINMWDFWVDGSMLKRGDWEFWNLYYNDSDSTIIIDPTPMDFYLSPSDLAFAETYNMSGGNTIINYTTPKRGVRVLANITMEENSFNISLIPVHDVGDVMYFMGSEDSRIVRVFNSSNHIFYLYTSSLVQHEMWDDNPNFVTVTDMEGNIIGDYAFSEPIEELGGYSVARAGNWERDIVLTNATINGNAIKFPNWVCDNTNLYYISNFSEQSLGIRFEENNQMGPPQKRNLTSNINYMLLYDQDCNGVNAVTNAKMTANVTDDTIDFSTWGMGTYEMNIGEQWGWPFLLNDFNTTTMEARIFKPLWDLWIGENTTIWIGAKEFNGKPIIGNASILSIKRIAYTKMGEEQSTVNIAGHAWLDSNGNAYVPLNLGNETWGDYTIRVKVTSSQTGKAEIQENRIFVMDPDMMMESDGDCMDEGCEEHMEDPI